MTDVLPSASTLVGLADALATMPDDTMLSDLTAGELWGLWVPPADRMEVTTTATWRGSRYTTGVQRRSVRAHRRILAPADRTTCLGLPTTSLERTWVDLAAQLDIHDLVAAGDSALRAGATPEALAQMVEQRHRARGVLRARVAVGMLDARSRSRPESRIRAALLLAGLPRPAVNRAVIDPVHGWLGEPDLSYEQARVAIEYNGAVHADVPQMRRDATRLLGFQRLDWVIRTYTSVDAFRRLDEVVLDVTQLLRARAPQLLTAAALARPVTYSHDRRRRTSRL